MNDNETTNVIYDRETKLVGTLCGFAGTASVIALAIGVWFVAKESAYHHSHADADGLAATLEYVGVAIALIGAAGLLLSVAGARLAKRPPRDAA